MANLGIMLADLFYPRRLAITQYKKESARKTLGDLDEAIKRGEADIERSMKDKSIDPNITMQKKQALDSFKEHMYYDEKSPYRKAYITLYGYPPEQSPSMQSALIRGEQGARMVNLPSRPMLPEEYAAKETALTTEKTQQVERQKQNMLGKIMSGEPGAIPSPEAYKAVLGGPAYETFASPGLGVVSRPYGSKSLETLVPPYEKEDRTSALLDQIRINQEIRAQEDQKQQMYEKANIAINETLGSLVQNGQYSASDVGGEKGGGIGRVIIDDPKLRQQVKRSFDATPYARKYNMTIDFVQPTTYKGFGFLTKNRTYVTIVLVEKGQEGKQVTPEETDNEQKNILNQSQNAGRK